MAIHLHVLEYSTAPVVNGVIRGVKIVGNKSRHGYAYPQEMLRNHIAAYEGVPCYMLHPEGADKRKERRQLTDHFGTIMNVREEPGKSGLWADLHIKQSHPMAQMVLENLDGAKFGLSHNARVEANDDKTEVLSIHRVNSVDLVDNPATTVNLFEDAEMTIEEMNAALDERFAALDAKFDKITESIAVLESKEPDPKEPDPKKKPKRITVLESAENGDQPQPTYGLTHDDFMAGLKGISKGVTA